MTASAETWFIADTNKWNSQPAPTLTRDPGQEEEARSSMHVLEACMSAFGCFSAEDSSIYGNPEVAQYRDTFEALKLRSGHVKSLFRVFQEIDSDSSGQISCREMLRYLHLERTKFTTRVFSIMDEDGSGEIDFREFCIALWNYCTLGKAALILFAFDLYDNDNSGQIDVHEIELMLKEVYGKSIKGNAQAMSVMSQISGIGQNRYDGDAQVNKEEFSLFVRKNPGLLYPAFQLQQRLQRAIMGIGFWEDLAEARIKLSDGGAYVSVGAMLAVQVNKNALDQLVLHEPDPEAKSKAKPMDRGALKDDLALHETALNAGSVADRREKSGFRKQALAVQALNKMSKRSDSGRERGGAGGGGRRASAFVAGSSSNGGVAPVPKQNRRASLSHNLKPHQPAPVASILAARAR